MDPEVIDEINLVYKRAKRKIELEYIPVSTIVLTDSGIGLFNVQNLARFVSKIHNTGRRLYQKRKRTTKFGKRVVICA